jgi:hypothetical protein
MPRSTISSSAFGISGLGRTLQKCALWLVIYFFGFLQLDIRWAMILLGAWYCSHLFLLKKSQGTFGQLHAETRGTVEDDDPGRNRKIFSKDLPSWVKYPDMERAEWINTILAQVWPYLDSFLKQVLKNVEEDSRLRERLSGYHIKSLRFPHVSLGRVPPRLGGIKFHEAAHRDEAIVDINVQYAGDLVIMMEAVLLDEKMVPAKASLRNLTLMSSQLRVHLRPLLADLPFVGSITVSFLEAPDLDFDLGGLANVFDIPGMSLLLRHIIQDQLEQTVVMPNSFTIGLVPEAELADLLKKRQRRAEASSVVTPLGVLSVHVVEAKGLVNKDIKILGFGKSDPYATIKLRADGTSHVFRTETVPSNLNPLWKMLVDLPVDDPDTLEDIQLEVWDDDDSSKDDFLGRCVIHAQLLKTAVLSCGRRQDVWKVLEGVDKGSVHVEVGWSELKLTAPLPEESSLQLFGANTSSQPHRAVVSLLIDSCHNLLGGRTGLKLPNPKVKVELCNVVQFTEIVVGSVDPVFEHRMSFLVNDPRSDCIHLLVLDDRKSDMAIGSLRLRLSDLMGRTGMALANSVYDLDARPLSSQGLSPHITLSMTMRYIYRPRSSSFGTHRSLQDLPKIMTAKVKPQQLLVTNFDVDECDDGGTSEDPKADYTPLQLPTPPQKSHKREASTPATTLNPVMTSTPKAGADLAMDLEKVQQFVRTYSLPRTKLNKLTDDAAKIQLSLKYNRKSATLSVVVHRIRNLEPTFSAIPNAYVKTRLIENILPGRSHRVSHTKRKTCTQKQSIHPVFEETLAYLLPPHELKMRRLEITVCHDGRLLSLGKADVLARCIVSLEPVHAVVVGGGGGSHAFGGDDNATITDWHMLHLTSLQRTNGATLAQKKGLNRSTTALNQ